MQNNCRKERIGKVVSNACNKSITVLVERKIKHPLYGKYIKKSKKFMAHDEKNLCKVGNKVKITETRPLSKTKRWRLVHIFDNK